MTPVNIRRRRPGKRGLYDPAFEHDACGVGFVAHMKGEASHGLIADARQILCSMTHRGACGAEPNTGDGAGILTALPDAFLRRVARNDFGVELPASGRFAAGNIFLPAIESEREQCKRYMAELVSAAGHKLVGWREVPIDEDGADIGPSARACRPRIEQIIISASDDASTGQFERDLYQITKKSSHRLRGELALSEAQYFYVCTLSTRVMVYKGMLMPAQLFAFYPDLSQPDYETHLAMVHSRFSTNTFPSWDRAQPNRVMSHNGEINTVRGNTSWMRARQGVMKSPLFQDSLPDLFPVIEPDCSDSGAFDNVLEFLIANGRSLAEAIMMMIPEAWQNDEQMPDIQRAFYQYHAGLMEPWDGPASIAFSDGKSIGAILDRNGLRPSRYYLTDDDRVIMASEVGVLDVPAEKIVKKGRLRSGRLFLIDFEEGRLIPDPELKNGIARQRPYRVWLSQNQRTMADLPPGPLPPFIDDKRLLNLKRAMGYTRETMHFMLRPLVLEQRDPVGSMGNDAALAALSNRPRLLYDYFRQLFAQVTNPAIDSIREEIIMSLACHIGPEHNLLENTPQHANRLWLPHPILTRGEMATLKALDHAGWRSCIVDTTWPIAEGAAGLRGALDRMAAEAEAGIDAGCSFIVLTDRAVGADRVAAGALLATGAVHQHLIRCAKRTRAGIVIETAEASEVHHHCLLLGYGADAINPYVAFEALRETWRDGLLQGLENEDAVVAAYRKGVAKGMLKVMAKMGISTLQSYKGAQIFEAVGLGHDVIDLAFTGTVSRLKGVDLETLARNHIRRHRLAFPAGESSHFEGLPNPGIYHWRPGGERHAWEPEVIAELQNAARDDSVDAYRRFADFSNERAASGCSLHGLLSFREGIAGPPLSIDDVEPVSEIVRRFATGAMSFGSISQEAHETLAVAMNRLGGKSNTGEGGEDSARFSPLPNGDSKRSAIKQVASGRFGVTAWYLANADEIQIKIAQGAKPGEGGELPGRKVDRNIARIRYSTPGVGLISPPPHHDIYSIEDLKQLIHDLKNANPAARISVKLVSEVGVGTIAAGVAKGYADHILISGASGGTGASPLTSIKHAGLPWSLGLAETHQTLVMNELRDRVVLQTDGGLKTGRDVAIAALLGAEEYGFSTAPLIALGCIMMRKCHLNTCPVGIATQDPMLREKFAGLPEHVTNYLFMVAEDVREIMASLGFRSINEMIGRVDCLDTAAAKNVLVERGLDLSLLLTPAAGPGVAVYFRRKQDHGLGDVLDHRLIEKAAAAIESSESTRFSFSIVNTDRAVGAMLSNRVVKRWGEDGLPNDAIHIDFSGSAGQSFGAFLAHGITLELEGDANDYVGKGLSGGRVVIRPPRAARFIPHENVIVGNVVLYGATRGQAFIRGRAAERFAVRNSGALAVVEGVGDHGCEYMTGGRVVVLGQTGRNFAAGMSGGIAYVLDDQNDFVRRCNTNMVELEPVAADEDIAELQELVALHERYTDSVFARELLKDWATSISRFVKVMPVDYKRVLADRQQHDEEAGTPAGVGCR